MELKKKILKLKEDGKSQSEITKILGCSSSTVSYHINPEVKEKVLTKKRENDKLKRENLVYISNIQLDKEIDIILKEVNWKYGEAICNARLIELGYDTFLPSIAGGEIDIIAVENDIVYKIQVKTISPTNYDSIALSLNRNSVNYKQIIRKPYENIDFFLIYDGNNIYKINFDEVSALGGFTLRYKLPKNNQMYKVKMASDYIF